MRLGQPLPTAVAGVAWLVGWFVLLSDGSTVLGLALAIPFLVQSALIALDVGGAAEEAARLGTRLRSRGDQYVVTSEESRALARFVLMLALVSVALVVNRVI